MPKYFKDSIIYYNPKLKKYSRELRKNMTEAERLLWSKLRSKQLKGLQFYRQRIIGNYIVDFYCPKAKLAIEVDGSQHYDERNKRDKIRDKYLSSLDLKILRISDRDIFENLDECLQRIYENCDEIRIIYPRPSLKRRGKEYSSLS